MPRSPVDRLLLAIEWSIRNGAVSLFIIVLLIINLLIYYVVVTASPDVTVLAPFLELVLLPLYLITPMLTNIRPNRDVVLEINAFRSWFLTYISKIIVSLFPITLLIAGIVVIDTVFGEKYLIAELLLFKTLVYLAVMSCCLVIRDLRLSRLLAISYLFILPILTGLVLTGTVSLENLWVKRELVKIIILYIFVTMTTELGLMDIARIHLDAENFLHQLRIANIVVSIILIVVFMFVFKKQQYSLK